MIRRTVADYTRQPWKNGKGVTVEMLRVEVAGQMLLRLSMATVAEDGPFSIFDGIDRNLTVIDGPGFWLEGAGIALDCAPLVPVAFAGDVPVAAVGTGGIPSRDFNVMTVRGLPRPVVTVERRADLAAGGLLALFALQAGVVDGQAVGLHDLCIGESPSRVDGLFLAVRVFGLPSGAV